LTTERIQYLGFEIGKKNIKYTESLKSKIKRRINIKRTINTKIQIYVPILKLIEKLIEHGFANKKNKPKAITK